MIEKEKHVIISPILKIIGDIDKIGHCKLGHLAKAFKYPILHFDEESGLTVKVTEMRSLNTWLIHNLRMPRFYHHNVHLLENGIAMTRDLPVCGKAILCVTDLDHSSPRLMWNPEFRRWSNMRFTKVGSLGTHLEGVILLKLLEQGRALIHAGMVCRNNEAIIIHGLPNRGKTWTVLLLMHEGYNFMSEDVAIISNDGKAYALPFTTSIKDLGEYKQYKQHKLRRTGKRIFFELADRVVVADVCKPKTLVLLERGSNNRLSEVAPEEAARIILATNRLEFNFPNHLLTLYCMAKGSSIYEYLEREKDIIKDFISHVRVFKIEFSEHSARDKAIRRLLIDDKE